MIDGFFKIFFLYIFFGMKSKRNKDGWTFQGHIVQPYNPAEDHGT